MLTPLLESPLSILYCFRVDSWYAFLFSSFRQQSLMRVVSFLLCYTMLSVYCYSYLYFHLHMLAFA